MSLLRPKTLEERIISLLANGEVKTSTLLSLLEEDGGKPTKQGLYAALRKLKSDDVVLVYKGTASLNVTWAKQMLELMERINASYGSESADILSLKDKESVSYHFNSLRQLDNFWGHMQDLVVKATPKGEPLFTYDPHYWFYPARKEIEEAHIAMANSLGKQFLMTVGGTLPLDRALQPAFRNEMRQYHMQQLFEREGYYLVVTGDFVFETQFDQETERKIGEIYAKYDSLVPEALQKLEEIPNIKTRTRLKISRNRTKAAKLKRKLSKHFFIKK